MKKYPVSLFITGFLSNLIKYFFLIIPSIILLIIGIWNIYCLYIGLALLIICIILAFAEQIRIRNTIINSNNPNFNEWQSAMLSSDWKKNVMDLVEDKISEDENKILEDTDNND